MVLHILQKVNHSHIYWCQKGKTVCCECGEVSRCAVNLAVVCTNGAIYLRCAFFATVKHCAWGPRSTAVVRIVVGSHTFSFGHAIVGRFSSIIDIRRVREWHQLVGARNHAGRVSRGLTLGLRQVRGVSGTFRTSVPSLSPAVPSERDVRNASTLISFCQNACV